MKTNKTKVYAQALAEVLSKPAFAKAMAGEERKIIANFLKLLEKNGLQAKGKEIVSLAEGLLLKRMGKRKIVFETASHLRPSHRVLLKEFVKEGDIAKEKINKELIAGVKIIVNNEKQLDFSMLKKMQNMF